MHIPTVTDQMLTKVIEAASSPVAVIFLGGPDRSRNALWRWRLKEIADDWDDRIIFLMISATENPEISVYWNALHHADAYVGLDLPMLIVFRGAAEFGRCIDCSRQTIEEMFRRSIKVAK